MFPRTLIPGAAIALATSLPALPAHALTTGHTSLAGYLTAGGNPTIQLNFDPGAGTVVPGTSFSLDVEFRSPEGPDPNQVWHATGPGVDGCVGGTIVGTSTFNGQLEILFDVPQQTAAAEVRSAGTPVTVDVYAGLALLASFASPPVFWGVVSDAGFNRIVLTPGTFVGGGRDATCFDNLRYGPLTTTPAEKVSWGRIKSVYR